jgi:hypothetical protein
MLVEFWFILKVGEHCVNRMVGWLTELSMGAANDTKSDCLAMELRHLTGLAMFEDGPLDLSIP